MDLATERRGVFELGNGRYVSNTIELKQSQLLEKMANSAAFIEFGTSRHLELFEEALSKLSSLLEEHELKQRALVINAPFASRTREGKRLSPNVGKRAEEWNRLFPDYFRLISSYGIATTPAPPRDLVVSTRDHLWKQAQDHYVDETYFYWGEQIAKFGALNGHGYNAAATGGRDSIVIDIPESVERISISGRRRSLVEKNRYTLNLQLQDQLQQSVVIDRWPIYRPTGCPAKFLPSGGSGGLFKIPIVCWSQQTPVQRAKLSIVDKARLGAPPLDLLITGEGADGEVVLQHHWSF